MKVQILGTGCPKCRLLKANTEEAIAQLDADIEMEEVTDLDTMMDMGMLVSPGFAIDGELQLTGKVLSADQVKTLILQYMEKN